MKDTENSKPKSELKTTSMYLPIKEIQDRHMSPRDIRNKVNGFVKD